MKCIVSKDGEVKRVNNDEARKRINDGWNYCQKSLWKEKTRKTEEKK